MKRTYVVTNEDNRVIDVYDSLDAIFDRYPCTINVSICHGTQHICYKLKLDNGETLIVEVFNLISID